MGWISPPIPLVISNIILITSSLSAVLVFYLRDSCSCHMSCLLFNSQQNLAPFIIMNSFSVRQAITVLVSWVKTYIFQIKNTNFTTLYSMTLAMQRSSLREDWGVTLQYSIQVRILMDIIYVFVELSTYFFHIIINRSGE